MLFTRLLLLGALLLLPLHSEAAISFIGSAGGNGINAASITVTLPGGMATNDLIIVAYSVGDDDFTQPTLALTTAGYTEITSSTLSADGGAGGDADLAVFYKFHNGTDTDVVTTASGTGADSSTACQVLVFRGVALVAQGGPFDATATTATGTSAGDPNPPSITFSRTNTWTVAVGAVGNAAAITLSAPPTNYTAPRASDVGNDTFDTAVQIAYRSNPTSPEDPGIFTDSGAGVAWAAVTIALRSAPTAAITGTITATVNESDIVTGGKTLIITLTNDEWIAAGAASFDLQRDEIIAGVDSAQSETFGWDLVPKALQGLAGVVRTSNTVVTITWDAFATYNITAQETITVTVPGTAILGTLAVVATPTFTVASAAPACNDGLNLTLLGVGGCP